MRSRLLAALALVPLAAAALVGCAPEAAPSPTHTTAAASPTATPTPTPTPVDPIAGLSLAQRVGQLFMVGTGTDAADPAALAAVSDRDVGGVFFHSGTVTGVEASAALAATFRSAVPDGVPLWIATDQEGGEVQVLHGPGFDPIPAATAQGELSTQTLTRDAAGWGRQLADAGITLNLAPVADIVTSPATAAQNKPIGLLHRQYGYDEDAVAAGAGAFADGMRQAGVLPTFKHFPGLGRLTANTDFEKAVDTTITADSPDVQVYRTLLQGGPALVMASTAIYQKIDPSAPAAFSPTVISGLLRGTLGFDGVVITDDVSAAASVASVTPAQRAVRAIEAGCDIVLVSTGPTLLPPMYDAVLAKAKSDPDFAALVDAAARRVVEAKATGAAG